MKVTPMLDLGKNQFSPPASPAGEFTASSLLERLSVHESKRLIFSYEGRDVLPGYHVTEVTGCRLPRQTAPALRSVDQGAGD